MKIVHAVQQCKSIFLPRTVEKSVSRTDLDFTTERSANASASTTAVEKATTDLLITDVNVSESLSSSRPLTYSIGHPQTFSYKISHDSHIPYIPFLSIMMKIKIKISSF
jgi:hypothetical protein